MTGIRLRQRKSKKKKNRLAIPQMANGWHELLIQECSPAGEIRLKLIYIEMRCTAWHMPSISLSDALLMFGFTQCSENRSEWEQKWPTLGHKLALFCCSPRDDSQEKRLEDTTCSVLCTSGSVTRFNRRCRFTRTEGSALTTAAAGLLIQITAEILSGVTLTSLLYRSVSARGSGGRGIVVSTPSRLMDRGLH